jgi:hypothetical protein
MEDADSDLADAEIADYGTDFSDTMSTQLETLMGTKALWHSRLRLFRVGIGNRIPRFPVFWGISRFPIPDWPGIGNRETARPGGRFPT